MAMSTLTELAESLRSVDIAINAIGGFLGSALLLWLAMGRQGIRTLRSRLARPTAQLQDRKTPENIFTGIESGAPAEWVREQLGPRNRIAENWWGYRFSDSLVSLTFDARCSTHRRNTHFRFPSNTFRLPATRENCPI